MVKIEIIIIKDSYSNYNNKEMEELNLYSVEPIEGVLNAYPENENKQIKEAHQRGDNGDSQSHVHKLALL